MNGLVENLPGSTLVVSVDGLLRHWNQVSPGTQTQDTTLGVMPHVVRAARLIPHVV